MHRSLVIMTLITLCHGCTPDDPSVNKDAEPTAPSTMTPKTPETFEVLRALEFEELERTDGSQTLIPESGDVFFVVELKMTNTTSTGLDISSDTMLLRTSRGLDYVASVRSPEISSACPEDALLSPNSTATCAVLFSPPQGTLPTALVHTRGFGEVTAPIDLNMTDNESPGCNRCEGECVDLLEDESHCGACGVSCAQSETCDMGACTPDNSCQMHCLDLWKSCQDQGNSQFSLLACNDRCRIAQSNAAVCLQNTLSCTQAIRCLDL